MVYTVDLEKKQADKLAKNHGTKPFSLEDRCPSCKQSGDFECVHLDLDEEFGNQITCNKCGAKFHEIFEFAYWEQVE